MQDYKRLTKRFRNSLMKPDIELMSTVQEGVFRLADLEDKIENGTLVELPCKVGDTVYMIWIDKLDENNAPIHKIQSGHIFAIQLQLESKEGNLDIWLRVEFGLTYCCRRIGDFYLTKAEAEAKLKELNVE